MPDECLPQDTLEFYRDVPDAIDSMVHKKLVNDVQSMAAEVIRLRNYIYRMMHSAK